MLGLLVMLSIAGPLCVGPTTAGPLPNTIPALRQWMPAPGSYTFTASSRVILDRSNASRLAEVGATFADDLMALTGRQITVATGRSSELRAGDIYLTEGLSDSVLGTEGYRLDIASTITISAHTETGDFEGTRSLLQLLRQSYAIPAGTARDWPAYPQRAMMVDLGLKFFSAGWLQNCIRELSYLKFNQLHLHLSDDLGYRLESSIHPEIVALDHYSNDDIHQLLALGARYHVTIVPEIDMPGHMRAMLAPHPELQLVDTSGTPRPDGIDLSKDAAYSFMQDVIAEGLSLFGGQYWHLGGDEYLTESEMADYPQLAEYAANRYGPTARARDTYYGFMNWTDSLVRSQHKRLRVWNDELYPGYAVPLNSDVLVDYWTNLGLDPQTIVGQGHLIMNSNSDYLYYILGANHPSAQKIFEDFHVNLFPPGRSIDPFEKHLVGAQLSIWSDNPDAETESEVMDGVLPPLRSLSQILWGSPKPVSHYSEFEVISVRLGTAT